MDEKGIVSWVQSSISEVLQSIDASELGLPDDVVISELSLSKLGILAVLVLRIWARLFTNVTAWPLTNEIGTSLRLLAEAVDGS